MKFQHTFLLVCAAVFMVGCAQNDATLQPQTNTPYIPPKLTKPSQHPLLHYPQEVDFLAKSVESKSIAQQEFTYRYYSPWFRTHILSKKEDASWANRSYGIKKQYYGENLQLISDEEIDEIISSTNFDAFGTLNTHAIMTQNAQMRNLPTQKPFFKKTTLPGEGYPFDYLQTSRIHIDEPIIVSHYTKDGAWAFIESSFASGWIPSDSFVLVDAKEKTTIIQAQKVALTKDNLPLYDEQKHFVSYAKIGAILPIDKEDEQFYYSYVYTKNATFDAQKISILLPKSVAKSVPFEFNKENISLIGNELLGEKYGWGGYLANRDCSAMTRDFTAPFGVWLPRNSAAQKDYGTYIPLKNLTPQEKEQMILKHGIAFLSLIYLKGHIMLYAGEFEGKPLVMHNVWGVRTMENGVEGRNVIGQAIISDLALGESEPNVPKAGLLVNRVEGILVKPADGKTNNFILKYPSVKAIKDNTVVFADGSTLPYDDQKQKTFDEKLENADIEDQLSQVYPAFAPIKDPALNDDPGRFRNDAFFQKLYGATKQ